MQKIVPILTLLAAIAAFSATLIGLILTLMAFGGKLFAVPAVMTAVVGLFINCLAFVPSLFLRSKICKVALVFCIINFAALITLFIILYKI